jgi:hypothetical protein
MTGQQLTHAPIAAIEGRSALARFRGRPQPMNVAPIRHNVEAKGILPQFPLMRLHFSLQVTAPASLPIYKSSMFQQNLLRHLRTMWCRQAESCRRRCQLASKCIWGRIWEPKVDPAWSPVMRRWIGSTPPPACIVWDQNDRRTRALVDDTLDFELVLLGQTAIRQLTAFVAAVLVAAERGIGRENVKAQLARVDVLDGPFGLAYPVWVNGAWQDDEAENKALSYVDGQLWAEQVISSQVSPMTRLHLRFLSPVRTEARGKMASEPHFQLLVRSLVRRLRTLSQVHGAGDWPPSVYEPLLALAGNVRLERHDTTWIPLIQNSSRQRRMPLDGFVGQAWYVSPADLKPLLPFMWLGQWVHIGRTTMWGNGRYELEVQE